MVVNLREGTLICNLHSQCKIFAAKAVSFMQLSLSFKTFFMCTALPENEKLIYLR